MEIIDTTFPEDQLADLNDALRTWNSYSIIFAISNDGRKLYRQRHWSGTIDFSCEAPEVLGNHLAVGTVRIYNGKFDSFNIVSRIRLDPKMELVTRTQWPRYFYSYSPPRMINAEFVKMEIGKPRPLPFEQLITIFSDLTTTLKGDIIP